MDFARGLFEQKVPVDAVFAKVRSEKQKRSPNSFQRFRRGSVVRNGAEVDSEYLRDNMIVLLLAS